MSAHTPGPWLASGDADANIVTVEASDKGYTTVCRLGYSTPTREANARLIAAAPDLLEALEGLFRAADAVPYAQWTPEMHAAQAAIAKARVVR